MSSIKNVGKNTLITILSNLTLMLLSFIFTVALAKYLGIQKYGIFSSATAYILIFNFFFDLGLNSSIVREVSRNKNKTGFYFWNSLGIEIFLCFISILLIYISLNILNYSKEIKYVIYVMALGASINTIGSLITSIFISYQCREYEAFSNILGKILYITIGVLGIHFHLSLFHIVILFNIGYFFQTIISYFTMVSKVCKPKLEIHTDSWPKLLKVSLPFALTGLFFDLYFNFDITMLSYMVGNEAVSIYSASYKFIGSLAIFPSAFITTIWPVFCKLNISSKNVLISSYEKSVKYLLLLAIPISFGTIIISDNLILSTFGKEFSDSIIVLKVLMIGEILFFVTRISGSTLGAIDKQNLSLFSLINCTLINILLNLYLIPKYSYTGAAMATVITEIALYIQYRYHLEKNNIKIEILKISSKPLISSTFMAFVIYALKSSISHLSNLQQIVIIVPIGAIIYIFCIIVLKTFTEEDIKIFKSILH